MRREHVERDEDAREHCRCLELHRTADGGSGNPRQGCVTARSVGLDKTRILEIGVHRKSLNVNRFRNSKSIRRWIGAALLSLILGQWALLVHAIEHARAPVAVAGAHDDDHTWGHQTGSAACDLFDQLLSGQAPGGAPSAAPGPQPGTSTSAAPTSSICRSLAVRAYEARGPPLS